MSPTETSPFLASNAKYSVFAHLNTEKAPLYRAILGVFVAERARYALALRPSEIQAALAAAHGSELLSDEVDAELSQLCNWGNLDDSPDTAEAASVEEFYRKRRLYQLSAAGEAAELALAARTNALQRSGAPLWRKRCIGSAASYTRKRWPICCWRISPQVHSTLCAEGSEQMAT